MEISGIIVIEIVKMFKKKLIPQKTDKGFKSFPLVKCFGFLNFVKKFKKLNYYLRRKRC